MLDQYTNFQQLARAHMIGVDFEIRLREVPGAILVLAPHGGAIEPGTSEIANAIAGKDYSFYAFIGGLHTELRERIMSALLDAKYPAKEHSDPGLQGIDPNNVCNRTGTSGGVQLELSSGFRHLLFDDLTATGRTQPTELFQKFTATIRGALATDSGVRKKGHKPSK
jgi:phage replication-related protein YjqB (UPF0714/DUF867 family)